MADANSVVSGINSGLLSKVSGIKAASIMTFFGWVIFIVIVAAGVAGGAWWYFDKKKYNKKISIFELVNGYYQPTMKDTARTIKLGSGGFEILFLKKLKVYRLAYGSRIGKDVYYYFIMPDGYWYNGLLSGTVTKDGTIPIISTSPLARAQYTALERYVDNLFSQKKGFWEQYGNWVLSIGFVVIMGVFVFLCLKEFTQVMGQLPPLLDRVTELIDKVNKLLAGAKSLTDTGVLVPA